MKPVPSLIVSVVAIVFFAAGYAKGAASGANPFMRVMLLPTGPLSFVEGPDADPPPWPADAPQASAFPPATRKASAPSSNLVMALNTPSANNASSAGYLASNPVPEVEELPPPILQKILQQAQLPVRRVAVKREVTFGTTREGRPVTIIWND
jgi:hypothetical protein